MKRAPVRGQAATEFALGVLVFITVLLFGIHFAEVGYLSAKVHEAAAAAVWDSTAYRAYSFGGFADSNLIAASTAGANTAARYNDWDGRASMVRSAPVMAMTRTEPMRVTCTGGVPEASYVLGNLAPNFGDPGGVSCNAEGDIAGFRIPTTFLEGSTGFFKAANSSKPLGSLTKLCGSGRATGGNCEGKITILLGDDALTDEGTQASECQLTSDSPRRCGNDKFYDVTLNTWDKSMIKTAAWGGGYTGAPERWAKSIVGGSGVPNGQITGFYLSFRGEESGFVEWNDVAAGGGVWQSNPMDAQMPGTPYRGAYNMRQNCKSSAYSAYTGDGYCFLGKFPCN